MILPAGFEVPPLPYLVPLLVAVVVVAGLLVRSQPAVTESTVLGLVPWMAFGAALHALYQLPVDLGGVSPLLGTPTVYLTTFALAGGVWVVLAEVITEPSRPLGALGGTGFLVGGAAVLWAGDGLSLVWPVVILALSLLLSAVVWGGLRRLRPGMVDHVDRLAFVVVFAHALDGVSTGVGFDLFSFRERSPLSRIVLEFAASLPTADLIGAGWLFVLVKLAVAAAVVWLFVDYVRDRPAEGYLLLGFVTAVGLGPGVQNVLLFAVR